MTRMIDHSRGITYCIRGVLGGILLFLSSQVSGQNGAGSVYSIFGVGELTPASSVQSRGMGFASIGLSSPYYLNTVNPAANDLVGNYFNHIGNVGFYYAATQYESGDATESAGHGGLSSLSFWFKINERWNSMVGLNPYSNVGYNINETDVNSFQEGTYDVLYKGSGGLNEFYFSNGVSLFKNLSVGLKLAFIFGNIDQTEYVTSDQNIQQFYIQNSVNIKDVYAEYSLNYRFQREKYYINLGAVYKQANLMSGSTLSQISATDLSDGTSDVILEEELYTDDYMLPQKFGLGLSLNTDKLVLAADVEYNQWSQVRLDGYDSDLNDTWRYAVGMEVTPDRSSYNYMSRMSYRVGGYYENSYLTIEGVSFGKVGVTGGVSMPLRSGSVVNIAYLRKFNGTRENNLIYESTHEVSVNFSLRNKWFKKRQYQ
ncbi:hypothetical protein [Reichenbachiella sp. MSK19-1]|uniref:hypothetical protein n=1 Tax=Reichenbachiella sp. MSK19-1 TaxID=1897631 RepID=UPI0011C3D174|nr:hypothetical protein [Reichenbachiella sp. MSK19-1]